MRVRWILGKRANIGKDDKLTNDLLTRHMSLRTQKGIRLKKYEEIILGKDLYIVYTSIGFFFYRFSIRMFNLLPAVSAKDL